MATPVPLQCSLFDGCVSSILASSYLLDRAPLHLPRGVVHFLLYIALEHRNQLAVRKLVEKWPYETLVLDFVTNPWCRRYQMVSQHCIEPHEYMGVFCSYASFSCRGNVSSLLEGVFRNVYHYRVDGSSACGLREVDLSTVVVEGQQASLLHNLVNGTIPVTHSSDYVTSKEAQKLGLNRPKLDFSSLSDASPLRLCISMVLGEGVTRQEVATLAEVCSQQHLVQVRISRLTVLGLSHRVLNTPTLHSLISCSTLNHIYVTESCFEQLFSTLNEATTSSLPSLWFSCEFQSTLNHPIIPVFSRMPRMESLLLATSQRASILGAKLLKLATQFLMIRSFCLLRQEALIHKDLRHSLAAFLKSVSETLEYLQLRRWSLTSTDLDSVLQCSNLRVLCVTEECGDIVPHYPLLSVADIFIALSQLPALEFFQWSENINMSTAGLLSLHNLLTLSLQSLKHFHISLSFILLSTTDLHNEEYCILRTILEPLLTGKTGDESCTTYRFPFNNEAVEEWLCHLRPAVCFRLGRQAECVTQLHQSATMGSYVY